MLPDQSDQHPNSPTGAEQHLCGTNPVSGKRELRDEEYRQRIHAATRELLDLSSIDDITMYQIAQTAGIGQGTLYRRYAHVGEICNDMLKSTTGQFMASLESAAETTTDGPLAQLEQTITRIIDFIDDRVVLFSAISKQYAGRKSFLPHKQPIAQQLMILLSSLLKRAVEQGEAEPCDVDLTVHALLSSLAPENYMYFRDLQGYDKERFVAGLRHLFIDTQRVK